jgi:multidrug resistance efflux pump
MEQTIPPSGACTGNGAVQFRPQPIPLPPPPPAPPRRRTWGRPLRRVLGLGGLVLAAWVVVPSFWSITSTQAVVNAPVVGVHAPIEGTVTPAAMDVGQAVKAGQPLLRIDNDLIDQGPLEKLRTEEAGLSERIAALRKHHAALAKLKAEFAKSAGDYQTASLLRIERELAAARQASASADALSSAKAYEKNQVARLLRSKSISDLEWTTALHTAEAAAHKAKEAKEVAARLEAELAAARKGVYVGTGDGRADVPYSRQRLHEVLMKQIDLEASIQELTLRHTEVGRQLRSEERRVRRHASHTVRAPADGLVWRRHVNTGTRVAGNAPLLLHLINPNELFIDALVHEKYAGYIRPGDKVRIKFIGSDDEAAGVVKHVLGRTLAWEERLLAAEVPPAGQREVHVIVLFEAMPCGTDLEEYRVGRPVEVVFGNQADFLRWFFTRLQP